MVSYHFNMEEVEELLPEVAILMEEAIAVQLELKEAYLKEIPVDSEEEIDGKILTNDLPEKSKKRIKVLTEELNDILEELDESGVLVRDLETGLVDFPSKFQGKEIYFCWHINEETIDHWHETECSFENRKKILKLD